MFQSVIHEGTTSTGNIFQVQPDKTGFHVSVHIDDVIMYEFIESAQLTHDEVLNIVQEMENRYGREREQTQTNDGSTENI